MYVNSEVTSLNTIENMWDTDAYLVIFQYPQTFVPCTEKALSVQSSYLGVPCTGEGRYYLHVL